MVWQKAGLLAKISQFDIILVTLEYIEILLNDFFGTISEMLAENVCYALKVEFWFGTRHDDRDPRFQGKHAKVFSFYDSV